MKAALTMEILKDNREDIVEFINENAVAGSLKAVMNELVNLIGMEIYLGGKNGDAWWDMEDVLNNVINEMNLATWQHNHAEREDFNAEMLRQQKAMYARKF